MHAQPCIWAVRRSLCLDWCSAVPVQDTDGTAYIIFSSEDNRVMHIHRLGPVSHHHRVTYAILFLANVCKPILVLDRALLQAYICLARAPLLGCIEPCSQRLLESVQPRAKKRHG